MKNLPRLPLEIWLMIFKIKWQNRCNFLTAFHNSPKNIDYHKPEKIDFSYGHFEVIKTIGYYEYYTMFNTTHIYCSLTYKKLRNTAFIQDYAAQYIIWRFNDDRFHYKEGFRRCRPIENDGRHSSLDPITSKKIWFNNIY